MRESNEIQIAYREINKLRHVIPEIDYFLESIGRVGEVAIVGGAIRDWILGFEPRDIDIVVDTEKEKLYPIIEPYLKEKTKFGGYHLLIDQIKVDIWPLCETWAFGVIDIKDKATLKDFPATVVYNIDAIVMRLSDGVYFENNFFYSIKNRILTTIFTNNPFLASCAARALYVTDKYHLTWDISVDKFFYKMIENGLNWMDIEKAQIANYGKLIVSLEESQKMIPIDIFTALSE